MAPVETKSKGDGFLKGWLVSFFLFFVGLRLHVTGLAYFLVNYRTGSVIMCSNNDFCFLFLILNAVLRLCVAVVSSTPASDFRGIPWFI
ncbi:hypothetical protein EUTSA_v10017482mg [Eutrema salsugineum]|uniref:Uncharacterized protein n=1 Tax=Eutrema salsugineum TaxID=72664 RepID=V4M697_EUTSA|nr:hypothetical protein EUTSA_v10017482mg [Eutrema salsugineum]